jgi:hypothetical protein
VVYNWLHNLGSGEPSRVLVDEGFGSLPVVDEFDRECRNDRGKIFASEIGCGGMSDLEKTVAGFGGREDLLDARELKLFRDSLIQGFQERGLGRIFGSLPDLILETQALQAIGNSQHVEALRSNSRVSGYVLTQLNDVAYEFHAGLLDLWRNPKLAYSAAQRVNQPTLLILKARREVAVPGDVIDVNMTLVNRIPLPAESRLSISVSSPINESIAMGSYQVSQTPGVQPLESVQVEMDAPGEYQITARLVAGQKMLAETSHTILALENVDWKNLAVKVRCWGQPPDSMPFQNEAWGKSTTPIPDNNTGPVVNLAANPATLSEEEWNALFQSIGSGEVGIIGALRPEDDRAIQTIAKRGVNLKLNPGIGSWMGCYHWVSDSPIFLGLPNARVAGLPYAELLPKYVLSELGGAVQAGSLRNTQSRLEPPAMLWTSDIELLQYDKGALLFCQYRIFEKVDRNPVASRLAFNLFRFAAQQLSQK